MNLSKYRDLSLEEKENYWSKFFGRVKIMEKALERTYSWKELITTGSLGVYEAAGSQFLLIKDPNSPDRTGKKLIWVGQETGEIEMGHEMSWSNSKFIKLNNRIKIITDNRATIDVNSEFTKQDAVLLADLFAKAKNNLSREAIMRILCGDVGQENF